MSTIPVRPTPSSPPRVPLPVKPPTAPPKLPSAPAVKFSIDDASASVRGTKVIVYGKSGIGKTTLCSMAPNAVFVPLDDGVYRIKHPHTGEPCKVIRGVTSFMSMCALFDDPILESGTTLVIDSLTKFMAAVEQHALQTYTLKGGGRASSLEEYGFGAGPKYAEDVMRLLIQRMDNATRRGINIVFIAQETELRVANPAGEDYLSSMPDLGSHGKNAMKALIAEMDHVLHIDLASVQVNTSKGTQKGKVGSSDRTLCVFAVNRVHAFAKNRELLPAGQQAIAFESREDDSVWRIMFPAVYTK